jgi:hypothetical protein
MTVTEASFRSSGRPVPGELRVSWRLPVLLLIVEKCWGRRASWAQMHVLSWFLLTRRPPEETQRVLDGNLRLGEQAVGVDPAVNLAIDRAVGAGLLEPSGRRVALTPAGEAALARIKESDGFQAEQKALNAISGKIGEEEARRAISGGPV